MIYPSDSSFQRGRRAFTLIEILVVIGILVLLIGILVPTINKARKSANRTRMASDLQAVATALDAYKTDFGDYPRVEYTPGLTNVADRPEPRTGAQILCWALLGPAGIKETPAPAANVLAKQDGADGPGFRTRISQDSLGNAVGSGKVFGPYLQSDKFRAGNPVDPSDKSSSNVLLWTLLDSNNKPILYAPASPKHLNPHDTTSVTPQYIYSTNTTALPNSALQSFTWDLTDLLGDATTNPTIQDDLKRKLFTRPGDTQTTAAANRVSAMLGDLTGQGGSGAPDGRITDSETAASTGPYVLWMAGPDEMFGPESEGGAAKKFTSKDVTSCDDVIIFNP